MTDIEEREVTKVRLRLLDVVKSFFLSEPDAEKMSRWRGTFATLTKEKINPVFDKSVEEIVLLLEKISLEELQDEFYHLFVDPFSEQPVSTSASYYLDGRSYGPTLVNIRSFLTQVNLEKNEDVRETEDSLVVMLDIMARLIEEEKNIESERARDLQGQLLAHFLVPLAEKLAEVCMINDSAKFYRACVSFFNGYLELEKGFLAVAE